MIATESDTRIKVLYREHYAEVLAYCVRRVGHADAEDVVSEARDGHLQKRVTVKA
jgi:DNA-directed RNA polymerase specialized sigma24 family protein